MASPSPIRIALRHAPPLSYAYAVFSLVRGAGLAALICAVKVKGASGNTGRQPPKRPKPEFARPGSSRYSSMRPLSLSPSLSFYSTRLRPAADASPLFPRFLLFFLSFEFRRNCRSLCPKHLPRRGLRYAGDPSRFDFPESERGPDYRAGKRAFDR